MSFIITWYGLQYVYTPTPKSVVRSHYDLFEDQGCTLSPDFIPSGLVIWDERLQYVPFDDNWTTYEIVYFCP